MKFLDLFEAPIGDLGLVGDFSKSQSFRHANDRKLLTNPVYVEKIKTAFSRTPYLFDLYFVNKPGLSGYQYMEKGLVPKSFVFAQHKPGAAQYGLGLNPNTFHLNPDAITVFFTNNTGAERMPMTAWIIAHRIGHAMRRLPDYLSYIDFLEDCFKKLGKCYGITPYTGYSYGYNDSHLASYGPRAYAMAMKYLAQEVCTMKSARDKNLRNFYEAAHEIFAQFLLDGRIAFNTAPRYTTVSYSYGRPNTRHCQQPEAAQAQVDVLSHNLPTYIENVLEQAVGECFVM